MADVVYGQATMEQPEDKPVPPLATMEGEQSEQPQKPPGNPAVVMGKATTASFGLSSAIPELKYADYFQAINSGYEDSMRQRVKSILDSNVLQKTLDASAQIYKQTGKPISMDEFENIKNTFKPVFPHTVFEEYFGKKYVDGLYEAHVIPKKADEPSYSWFADVVRDNPQFAKDQTDKGSYYVGTRQILANKKQDVDDQIESQGYPRWIWDSLIKPAIPLYTDVQMRGNVPGVSKWSGLFTGNNIAAQRQALLNLPHEDLVPVLDQIGKGLTPHMFSSFLDDMIELSTSKQFLESAFPAIDVTTIGGIAKGLKTFYSTAREAGNFSRGLASAEEALRITGKFKGSTPEPAQGVTRFYRGEKPDGQPFNPNLAVKPGSWFSTDKELARKYGDLHYVDLNKEEMLGIAEDANHPGKGSYILDEKLAARKKRYLEPTENEKVDLSIASLNRAVDMYRQTNNAVRDTVRSSANLDVQPATVAAKDGAGDLGGAAEEIVMNRESKGFSNLGEAGDSTKEVLEDIHPILQPSVQAAKENPGRFGLDNVLKWYEQRDAGLQTFLEKVKALVKVNQIPGITKALANEAVIKDIMASMRGLYRGIENQIVGSSMKLVYNPHTNNHGFWFYFGNTDGLAFKNEKVAANAAKNWGFEDARVVDSVEDLKGGVYPEVVPKGAGFLVAKWQPLNLQNPVLRKALIQTKQKDGEFNMLTNFKQWLTTAKEDLYAYTETPQGKGLVGRFLRTAEETFSKAERENRGIAEFVPQALIKYVREGSIDEIKKLAKGLIGNTEWKEWERAVKYSQRATGPKGEIGHWFTPGELDDFYQRTFGRYPTEPEYKAYLAMQDVYDKDYVLRNLRLHANMARVGTESHRIWFVPKKGQDTTFSPWFNGIKQEDLPTSEHGVLKFDGKGGYRAFYGDSTDWTKFRKEIEEEHKQGKWHVVRVYDPDLRELKDFSDKRIRYVVVPAGNHDTRNLPIFNMPRREGGHFEYDYPYWVRQATIAKEKIGGVAKAIYTGDSNLAPITIRAMGEGWVKHLNHIRELLLANKEEEAKAYSNTNFHIDWDKVSSWFKPSKDPTGRAVPARFSLEEPFHIIPRGKNIGDTTSTDIEKRWADRGFKFINGTKSGSDARLNQVQFTGERDAHDLFTVNDVGSKGKPVYEYSPAAVIDPITSLNRSLSRMVKSYVMDDYKYSAVEHWIKEAIPYLKETSEKQVWYSPFHYFHNPEFRAPASQKEADFIETLKGNNWKIQQFIGVPDKLTTAIQSATERMVDELYEKKGPKFAPGWALTATKDPASFIRGVTFHEKLGLFNIPQLWKQMSTFVNVWGMAGTRYAAPGAAATFMHQVLRATGNEAMVEALDRKLASFKLPGMAAWKSGEFKESWEAVKNTGFLDGVHSHVFLDAPLAHEVISSKWGDFLNWGSFFFREGANNTKIGAWHTAFKEWRDANPVAKLTDNDVREILGKARTYNHNMDRASASMLQSGLGSIPLQFQSYIYRLMELMTGKRLSPIQKARFFVTASAMYGVPVAAGLYGLPADDMSRPYFKDKGYVPGENWISTVLMEGLPNAFVGAMTGKHYDYAQQFGPKGYDQITQTIRADKQIIGTLFGAAGSSFANAIALMDPFLFWLNHAVIQQDADYKLQPEHVFAWAKEITSVNQFSRWWTAIHTGQWMSKNDRYLANTNAYDATYMSIFGLQPTGVVESGALEAGLKSREENIKLAERRFTEEFHKGLRELKQGNHTQAAEYIRNANATLINYPKDKYSTLVSKAAQDYKPLIDSVPYRFYIQAVKGLSEQDQEVLRRAWSYDYNSRHKDTE